MGTEGVWGAVTAIGKEIKTEIRNKKCGHCCDKPYHMALKPLELFCEKNLEEFGTLH